MFLNFEKWHGCLNDFVVIWISDSDGDIVLDSIKRQTKHLCDRRGGIGADGILVLRRKKSQDLTPYGLTIINSDGSIAKTCGNGLRCAALSVLKTHQEHGDPKQLPEFVEFLVEGETLTCRFAPSGGSVPLVIVEMGVPALNSEVSWHNVAKDTLKKVAEDLGIPALAKDFGVCTIGNPHIVIHSDQASRELLLKLGPALQKSSAWDGINVHLTRPLELTPKDQARAGQELGQHLSEGFQVYVWERGAGETMACGSGACAIAALALESGLLEREDWVAIDMPGGRLYVKQAEANEPVMLAGPGVFSFNGRISI